MNCYPGKGQPEDMPRNGRCCGFNGIKEDDILVCNKIEGFVIGRFNCLINKA